MKLEEFLKQNKIYSIKEASILLDIKPDTLRNQCRKGKRDAVNVDGVWLIRIL